jgi:hypothetical protein
VKDTTTQGDVTELQVALALISGHDTRAKPYGDGVDAYGVYCPENNMCYLVPRSAVAERTTFAVLRVAPTKNGQTKRVRSAAEFALS